MSRTGTIVLTAAILGGMAADLAAAAENSGTSIVFGREQTVQKKTEVSVVDGSNKAKDALRRPESSSTTAPAKLESRRSLEVVITDVPKRPAASEPTPAMDGPVLKLVEPAQMPSTGDVPKKIEPPKAVTIPVKPVSPPSAESGRKAAEPSKTDAAAAPQPAPVPKSAATLKKAVESATKAADTPKPEAAPEKKAPEVVAPTKPKALPQLTEDLRNLRNRVRWTLATYHEQDFGTQHHTATDILHCCLAFGCQTDVYHGNDKINGITCLCWNYPCAGYELLTLCDRHIAARVGYGLEINPSQFLATLAFSRVGADYPIRVGKTVRSVADLVAYEKLTCRRNTDQSLKLLGLAFYAPVGETWKNSLGEEWSIERLVEEEMSQSMKDAPCGGTYRLMGLSAAAARHGAAASAPTSSLVRAQKFIKDYQIFAFKTQNPDGSWHPAFFAAVGTSNDQAGVLRSTGHVVEWLSMSLNEEALYHPVMARSVDYLASQLGSQQARWPTPTLNSQNIGNVLHAVHALSLYDQRVFKPHDLKEAPAEDDKETAQSAPASDPEAEEEQVETAGFAAAQSK